LSEADEKTRAEAFSVSLKASLSAPCIAEVMRWYGFVKLIEEVQLE